MYFFNVGVGGLPTIRSFIHSLSHSLTYSLAHSATLITHSATNSFIQSFIHSFSAKDRRLAGREHATGPATRELAIRSAATGGQPEGEGPSKGETSIASATSIHSQNCWLLIQLISFAGTRCAGANHRLGDSAEQSNRVCCTAEEG